MERRKLFNIIIYGCLIAAVIVYAYKNNGLLKQLADKKIALKKTTKRIEKTQAAYKKLETEYKKITQNLLLVKEDFSKVRSLISKSNTQTIQQIEEVSSKLSIIIEEQETYKFLDFEEVHPTGAVFTID